MEAIFFSNSAAFRRWLSRNHATKNEILVGLYRKSAGQGISYAEALDEALAFGWIDGVRKRLNDDSYTIRFTPRKQRSIWSAVNIKRAEELMSLGRMAPAGIEAFRARDEKRSRLCSCEREQMKLDPQLAVALRANSEASAFFEAQPPGYRKTVTFWIMSAKRDETRARRQIQLIERSASGKRIDMLSPNRKSV